MRIVDKSLIPNDSSKVEDILDLGTSPLANGLVNSKDLENVRSYPLKLGRCTISGHVQLTTFIEPKEMFTDYLYISSVSSTLKTHLEKISDFISNYFKIGNEDLCIDIGSNDGTLLSGFLKKGKRVLGVDPATNLAKLAKEKGVNTIPAYFGLETASQILNSHGKAKIISLTNTFPHLQQLDDFIKGIDVLLKEDGVVFIETHYLADIYDQVAFDTIYHEHVSYWHLSPIKKMFENFGFEISYAERIPLHHGQLRILISRKGVRTPDNSVNDLIKWEKDNKIGEKSTCQNFAKNSIDIKKNLNELLNKLKNEGKNIAGYGAPAKATTLLNFLGLNNQNVQYAIDRSPLKQGLFIPGTGIEIKSPEILENSQPDYLILFAWNFKEEILNQLFSYRNNGGKFIIPLPHLEII
ncbi:MAG: SAM-dependent methyltransferase [Chloroflexi bacterium]|nr:SAM-dependent methyltransferase [Chloroflexota bacterium]|tara:strand:+ start:916 stop:2145 length:1230 start_codon:yes stop_codon:yes gene_type:complete